ncbi:centrosomal protein of 131 kDa isoform X2 [Nymphalis io]|nr:centrosomal protein of 131 kDa isoform X2 [Nymphalis io]
MSLGTKIKAKAQSCFKNKNNNTKNFIKYRNIAKKGRKTIERASNDERNHVGHNYGLEVTITEKSRSPSPSRYRDLSQVRSSSPQFKNKNFESYFLSNDGDIKSGDGLSGRVSFAPVSSETDKYLDTYTHRLGITKQQLSLVEEESTQDVDSIPSQNIINFSPKSTFDDNDKVTVEDVNVSHVKNNFYNYSRPPDTLMTDSQNYSNFFDDFHNSNRETYKSKFSSTAIHTDTSSKDSGYPDSGLREEKVLSPKHSLPSTSFRKRSDFTLDTQVRPKSLDYPITKEGYCDYESENKCEEPLNHSRLLYKDFFLKKEGHLALPPQNSPTKCDVPVPGTGEIDIEKTDKESDLVYPKYLLNSTTKAYTSKVIEDYKKELEAINNLHELTLKDIKTDAISPTPLNIDELFEQNSNNLSDDKKDSSDNSQESSHISDIPSSGDKNSLETNKKDISKVTTKELIQNYLKVKNDYTKEGFSKNFKKFDKKLNNINSKCEENSSYKQFWNNRNSKINDKSNLPVNMRHQKNVFTARVPLSARIDSVQTDKDIESWMSLSAPSPRSLEISGLKEEQVETPVESKPKTPEKKVETGVEKSSYVANVPENETPKELNAKSTVLDIYSMLKEIESYGDNPVTSVTNTNIIPEPEKKIEERCNTPKDNFMEIFEFLEKVEQSANDALSVVTNTTPQTIPKLEVLLKLPQTELAQRLVTASLQLEERSCCIALLQESLANHKEQMISKVNNLEKQSHRNIAKVKQECEETIKRHQSFIDQLINDKKTLNHRIEQLVDERRSLEERWKRSAQALEERYKLELRNQHDKMAAAQQVARQRWVRQKAEKIKELTVKGLEGELREMAERQQKEISDIKMHHAEQSGRLTAKHAAELEDLRRTLEEEKEVALAKERQLASTRMEKQILELEVSYQEQRTRLIAEMRAENERIAAELVEKEKEQKLHFEKWKEEQEKLLAEMKTKLEKDIDDERNKIEERLKQKRDELQEEFEHYKKEYEANQQALLKKKETDIATQHRLERDREIEKAIESMEAEAQAGRKELQDALRRNKEQYEAELQELAETERATLKRYQQTQARVRETEDRCAELEVTISQLETRNRVLTEKNSQLEARAEEIRASCESSWRSKVENLEKVIEDMKKTHEEQMHQLYAKVKVAVARKDSAIQALTRETAKYQEKITLLEQKLQQQRKDFLKSK